VEFYASPLRMAIDTVGSKRAAFTYFYGVLGLRVARLRVEFPGFQFLNRLFVIQSALTSAWSFSLDLSRG
jgi:hypothetical protein